MSSCRSTRIGANASDVWSGLRGSPKRSFRNACHFGASPNRVSTHAANTRPVLQGQIHGTRRRRRHPSGDSSVRCGHLRTDCNSGCTELPSNGTANCPAESRLQPWFPQMPHDPEHGRKNISLGNAAELVRLSVRRAIDPLSCHFLCPVSRATGLRHKLPKLALGFRKRRIGQRGVPCVARTEAAGIAGGQFPPKANPVREQQILFTSTVARLSAGTLNISGS